MKKLSLIAAVIAFVAMAGVSFAANTAGINVTSEPIANGVTCGKAGGFTVTFDNGTVFNVGDKITFDLDYGVTLCKNVDLLIAASGAVGIDYPALIDSATAIAATGTANEAITMTPGATIQSTGGGVVFRLTGNDGSQRVTLEVLGDDATTAADGYLDGTGAGSLTFDASPLIPTGEAASAKFAISFLDGTAYTGAPITGVFMDLATTTTVKDYVALADVEANSICIDISDYSGNTVNANFDSSQDKFTFVPSNPQIAHIVGGDSYSLLTHQKRETGFIPTPGTATQGSTITCDAIQNEEDLGFCSTGNQHANNKLIIQSSSTFDATEEYIIELEIRVNGQAGANGIYWADGQVGTDGFATADAALANVLAGTAVPTSAYLADDTTATRGADTDCDLDDAAKAVKLVTTATTGINLVSGDKYLYIDMPSLLMDSAEVSDGDVVSVAFNVYTVPCGTILEGTWEIGTVGCPATTTTTNQRYPYFAKGSGAYANAIIITNVGATDGVAQLTMYEDDGDMFTASVNVAAHDMFVDLVNNISWTAGPGVTGTQGDAKAYIELSADFVVDGAAMITNAATGESIGYLPRQ